MERDIKVAQFAWTEKWAWKQIESLDFKKQASCKLIYTALCIASSMQMNSPKIKVYKFDLARFASISEKTVQRYLPELEDLGIISMSPQDRKSNGKFEKVSIWLKQGLSTAGHLGDRSETDGRQMEDTESDNNINIITKERKKERKEEITHSNKFEEEREVFETFRKKYPGTKVGLDTEFANFQKKTKDWKEVLPLLENAIEKQTKSREYLKRLGKFVPEWKMLKTWINNRCWEEEGESVKPFKERSDDEHYEEYVNYDSPNSMFRAKNKDELPYRELRDLSMRLENRLSIDPKYK